MVDFVESEWVAVTRLLNSFNFANIHYNNDGYHIYTKYQLPNLGWFGGHYGKCISPVFISIIKNKIFCYGRQNLTLCDEIKKKLIKFGDFKIELVSETENISDFYKEVNMIG